MFMNPYLTGTCLFMKLFIPLHHPRYESRGGPLERPWGAFNLAPSSLMDVTTLITNEAELTIRLPFHTFPALLKGFITILFKTSSFKSCEYEVKRKRAERFMKYTV